MGQSSDRVTRPDQIPGDCYNLARLAIRRADGCVTLGLAGMSDNLILLAPTHWRCWNRQLDEDLLSWSGFRNADRLSLLDPVDCIQTVHHSYARTIIHHVYHCLRESLQRELQQHRPPEQGAVIPLLGHPDDLPRRLR